MSKINNILDRYPEYEAKIGIEVHVQLNTKTKIFCFCPNQFGEIPNKNICPICSGYPGTLPVLNKKVVDHAIMAGLATHCDISKVSEFARKHYRYPDLPKNYQISQSDKPICTEGYVPIDLPDGKEKRIRLIRIHMEEDAGKTIHEADDVSYIDLNRAGTPLIEIVSHPDIANNYEAKAYLMRLRAIVQYLGISNANMEEGSFRADVNLSIKTKESEKLGTRVELKNINSFKFIGQAIDHEIERQINILQEGSTIHQETRLWDERKQKSIFMRSKEESLDYRYYTEPDLPLIAVDSAWLERLSKKIPELPHQKYHRFQEKYYLNAYEADILVGKIEFAQFFEKTVELCKKPKQVSNWILRDLLGYLKEHKTSLEQSNITPELLAELITIIEQGVINIKVATNVFIEMTKTGKYPSVIIDEKNLKQIGSPEELEKIVLEIINANPKVVANYKAGNKKVFTFFIGQAMKTTSGKGNPKILQELFKKHLE
jgi:aspartyl-tRNA(Asn)/glutamyl-tRNA(Gln) amidotransferase subunit B